MGIELALDTRNSPFPPGHGPPTHELDPFPWQQAKSPYYPQIMGVSLGIFGLIWLCIGTGLAYKLGTGEVE